jgi:hypothetical protein
MKEYIDRGALLKELERFPHLQMAGSIVRSMPKEDVVEVVRCKDCKYWENGKDYEPYCNHFDSTLSDTTENDFCSYGKRKEQE